MNDLEFAVRPFLSDMVEHGAPAALTPDQLTSLAAWSYKTMLVFDLLSRSKNRRFRSEDRNAFYKAGKPPLSGLTAWFATYFGTMLCTATDKRVTFSHDDGRNVDATAATFSVGRFAFQLLSYDHHHFPPPSIWIPYLSGHWIGRLSLFWPVLMPAPSWPPVTRLDDKWMIALRDRWEGPVDGLQVGPATNM